MAKRLTKRNNLKRNTLRRKTLKRNTLRRKTLKRKTLRRKSFKKMRGGMGGNCRKFELNRTDHVSISNNQNDKGKTVYNLEMEIGGVIFEYDVSFSKIEEMLNKFLGSNLNEDSHIKQLIRDHKKGRNIFLSINRKSCQKRLGKIERTISAFEKMLQRKDLDVDVEPVELLEEYGWIQQY